MGPIDSWSLWDAPARAVPLRSNKQVNFVLTCEFDMHVFLGLDAAKFSIAHFMFSGHKENSYH